MTEMDLRLYELTRKLRAKAEKCEALALYENLELLSSRYYGKADAFRESAELIELEFRDNENWSL